MEFTLAMMSGRITLLKISKVSLGFTRWLVGVGTRPRTLRRSIVSALSSIASENFNHQSLTFLPNFWLPTTYWCKNVKKCLVKTNVFRCPHHLNIEPPPHVHSQNGKRPSNVSTTRPKFRGKNDQSTTKVTLTSHQWHHWYTILADSITRQSSYVSAKSHRLPRSACSHILFLMERGTTVQAWE